MKGKIDKFLDVVDYKLSGGGVGRLNIEEVPGPELISSNESVSRYQNRRIYRFQYVNDRNVLSLGLRSYSLPYLQKRPHLSPSNSSLLTGSSFSSGSSEYPP